MSYKSILFYIFFILLFLNLQAQKETWHWYFGVQAGIDFNSGTPVADTSGKMDAGEGASSISDSAGNLLFYTNGLKVWNKSHEIMDNGTNLLGSLIYNQSVIIIKQPGNDSIYYIFTVGLLTLNIFNPPPLVFKYSIVNIHQNNGLGKVILKNVWISDSTTEAITAIQHCNGKDMWVIVANVFNSSYRSFLLTSSGLNSNPVISSAGVGIYTGGYFTHESGYMKASPNGKKIAVTYNTNYDAVNIQLNAVNLELFDFDNLTGILSNPVPVMSDNLNNSERIAYGVEFSPNQKYLYVSYPSNGVIYGYIYQYNITSNDSATISQSAVQLYLKHHLNNNLPDCGALQIACDKKIYIAFHGNAYVGVINYPDSAGFTCNFEMNGVYLNGKICTYGLPTFFPGFFNASPNFTYIQNCLRVFFKPVCDSAALDSIRWDFGDIGSGNNTSSLYSPVHLFSDTGTYTIKVIYYYPCNISDTVLKTITVQLPAYTFPLSYITDTITPLCKQLNFKPVCDSASLDSLKWNFGDPASGSTNTASWFNPWHLFSDTGTYNISLVLYAYCRTDTVYKTVHVGLPINGLYLGADTTLCSGETLQLGGTIISPLPVSYLWQDGVITPIYTVSQAGKYWQQVNAGGCFFSDTINISYLDPPTINLPNDTIICEESRIEISIPQGIYTLLWDNGTTYFNRSFTQAGNYWVTATNFCGNATDAFVLQTKNCNCYLYFPNTFTPNGNDLNECFGAVYNCDFETYHFYIYNRWGHLLFETTNPAECWDGKYKNDEVISDVYVWMVEYKSVYDKAVIGKKGMVTVVR